MGRHGVRGRRGWNADERAAGRPWRDGGEDVLALGALDGGPLGREERLVQIVGRRAAFAADVQSGASGRREITSTRLAPPRRPSPLPVRGTGEPGRAAWDRYRVRGGGRRWSRMARPPAAPGPVLEPGRPRVQGEMPTPWPVPGWGRAVALAAATRRRSGRGADHRPWRSRASGAAPLHAPPRCSREEALRECYGGAPGRAGAQGEGGVRGGAWAARQQGLRQPTPPYAAVLARSTQSAWLSAMTAFL
jgi:hypothetical protein